MITSGKTLFMAAVLSTVLVAVYCRNFPVPNNLMGVWIMQSISGCPNDELNPKVMSVAEHEKMFKNVTQFCHTLDGSIPDNIHIAEFTLSNASANLAEQPDYMQATIRGRPSCHDTIWNTEVVMLSKNPITFSNNTRIVTIKTACDDGVESLDILFVIHVQRVRNNKPAPANFTELQIQSTPYLFDYGIKFGASTMVVMRKNDQDEKFYEYICVKVEHAF